MRGRGRNAGRVCALLLMLPWGSACEDGSVLLGPEASQGIEGLALLGPLCPVVEEGNPCPDEPFRAWIRILEHDRDLVTRIRTGEDGRFRVGLEPGSYVVHPESGDPFPRASEQAVEVSEGHWTAVTVHYDTGIR